MKQIKLKDLKDIILGDVELARNQVISESGDIISDRVVDVSSGQIIPGVKEKKESVWVGVTGEEDYLLAMREEKFGSRPFANTVNWIRTKVPFIRSLQSKLPWIR
ncbi:MAG: hypothetical protein GF411_02710 [Candidatus Lokiarchaeota archaeon]|nr:hypothetical protein [Candidatus Lokiarchaeota archaeon]